MAKPSAEHVDLMFPNRYLKAADLRGKDVTLTVDHVKIEELKRTDGSSDNKPIVYFAEMVKRQGDDNKVLVLGKTTAMQIAASHGKTTEAWHGKKITLYPARVKAFGEMVDAIRIRLPDEKRRGA